MCLNAVKYIYLSVREREKESTVEQSRKCKQYEHLGTFMSMMITLHQQRSITGLKSSSPDITGISVCELCIRVYITYLRLQLVCL